MKAERRHELQQSDLAKVIKQAPGFWQQSGGKYLLLGIAVVVVVILVRYRISSNREASLKAMDSLAQSRVMIEQMERLALRASFMPPGQAAVTRRQFYNDATSAIRDATASSDDRTIAAEALIARGDLDWTTSMIPELQGATTQQSLQFKDPKELFASAAEAYQNVLTNYNDVKHAAIAARFGLAAIAENRGDFDSAAKMYEAIAAQSNDIGAYQQLASTRLRTLANLKKPVILAKPATEPVELPLSPTTAQGVPPLISAPTPTTSTSQPVKTQAGSATTRSSSP